MFSDLFLADNNNGHSFGWNLCENDHGNNNSLVPGNFNFDAINAPEDEAFLSNPIFPNLAPNLDNTNGSSFGRNLHEPDHRSNNALVPGNFNFNTTNPLEDEAFHHILYLPALLLIWTTPMDVHLGGISVNRITEVIMDLYLETPALILPFRWKIKLFSSYPIFPSLALNLELGIQGSPSSLSHIVKELPEMSAYSLH